jgi:uncharacterized LabA/DUF88 family protein
MHTSSTIPLHATSPPPPPGYPIERNLQEKEVRMMTERALLFVDYPNLAISFAAQDRELDLAAMRDHLARGREIIDSIVYIGSHPDWSVNYKAEALREQGFLVRTRRAKVKPDGSLRCNQDVELALDAYIMSRALRPEVVILASGDSDFLPLLEALRWEGVRVEIASCPWALSQELAAAASRVIDLEMVLATVAPYQEKVPPPPHPVYLQPSMAR